MRGFKESLWMICSKISLRFCWSFPPNLFGPLILAIWLINQLAAGIKLAEVLRNAKMFFQFNNSTDYHPVFGGFLGTLNSSRRNGDFLLNNVKLGNLILSFREFSYWGICKNIDTGFSLSETRTIDLWITKKRCCVSACTAKQQQI